MIHEKQTIYIFDDHHHNNNHNHISCFSSGWFLYCCCFCWCCQSYHYFANNTKSTMKSYQKINIKLSNKSTTILPGNKNNHKFPSYFPPKQILPLMFLFAKKGFCGTDKIFGLMWNYSHIKNQSRSNHLIKMIMTMTIFFCLNLRWKLLIKAYS